MQVYLYAVVVWIFDLKVAHSVVVVMVAVLKVAHSVVGLKVVVCLYYSVSELVLISFFVQKFLLLLNLLLYLVHFSVPE